MPEETRSAAWLRQVRPSGALIVTLGLVIASLVVLAPSLKTFFEQRQEIARLEAAVAAAEAEVDQFSAEIDRWSDPVYVEAQARDRLFYVFPGERSYLVVGHDPTTDADGDLPISDEIQATRIDWLGSLLGSVYEAGLTGLDPEELQDEGMIEAPQQEGDQ